MFVRAVGKKHTYKGPLALGFLLGPHLKELLEIFIAESSTLEGVQVLTQVVLYMPVSAVAQQLLNGGDKFCIEVARKGVPRVVGQDAHNHNRIVLDVVRDSGRSLQVFANAVGRFLGGGGARLSELNDAREVNKFISVLGKNCKRSVYRWRGRRRYIPSPAGCCWIRRRFSEKRNVSEIDSIQNLRDTNQFMNKSSFR